MIRLGKHRPPRSRSCESSDGSETHHLIGTATDDSSIGGSHDPDASSRDVSRHSSITSIDSDISCEKDICQLPADADEDEDHRHHKSSRTLNQSSSKASTYIIIFTPSGGHLA